MDTFDAADLVTAWEQGQRLSLSGRGQVLLRLLGLDAAAGDRLSVGQRDGLLMGLRARVFGSQVISVAACPACSERLEVTFDLANVHSLPPGDPTGIVELETGGYAIKARPPRVGDLAALDRCGPGADLWAVLFGRCVVTATRGKRPVALGALPEPVVTRLVERLAEADPQADVRLALSCAACGHRWSVVFDIVSYFWHELETWVGGLLREVHALASAYGWHERDIMAMSARRRSLYLEMVRA